MLASLLWLQSALGANFLTERPVRRRGSGLRAACLLPERLTLETRGEIGRYNDGQVSYTSYGGSFGVGAGGGIGYQKQYTWINPFVTWTDSEGRDLAFAQPRVTIPGSDVQQVDFQPAGGQNNSANLFSAPAPSTPQTTNESVE